MFPNRFRSFSRRDFLLHSAAGFGSLGLAGLLHGEGTPAGVHHKPKAKSVIFLYMDGGPSAMDTFDPKPRLTKDNGKPMPLKVEATQFNNIGTILQSPWKFKPSGNSGIPVSSLFPAVAKQVDNLSIVRSVVSNFSEHTNANYFLHSGHGLAGRPSMGSWLTYGLGTESMNLPGFIVLGSGMIPPGGADCFHSGFLPASHQASVFARGAVPVANLQNNTRTRQEQDKLRELMNKLDAENTQRSEAVESAIKNYELAFQMQNAVPEVYDLSKETEATRKLYGIGEKETDLYGKQCLIARRLVERGVRCIELLCPNLGHDRWDQHQKLFQGHTDNARAVDGPIAGLIADLKSRGLLESTIVWWGGEFGRTPMAQGTDGRDHNPFGFTMWLAGGGFKGGHIHGATDDFGYHAVSDKVTIHDIHATILHQLGIDHTRLTFPFGGRNMRLTDVHGEVIRNLLA